MAGQSSSTLSTILRPNIDPVTSDLLFREADYTNFLRENGRVFDLKGASPHGWIVYTSANGSTEAYSEGQAPPAAGRQTPVPTSLGHFRVRAVVGHTADTRDNDARGGYFTPVLSEEERLGLKDLIKAGEDQLVGSTQDRGYASIIDSTGTYASLSASTYSIWSSQEDGSINTLGLDDMENLYWELRAGTTSSIARNARPTHVLVPPNQAKNFGRTIGPAGTTSLYRFGPGQGFDPGIPLTAMSFQGCPFVVINGQTSTELYMVDVTDIELLIVRDVRRDEIPGNPEMESAQISMHLMHKVKRRNKHGKMTGITA